MDKGLVQWIVTVVTALTAYVVLVEAQNYVDDVIVSIVHILPERLPRAQRTLTIWFAFFGWLTALFFLAYLAVMALPFVAMLLFRTFEFGRFTYTIMGMMPILTLLRYGPVTSVVFESAHMNENFRLVEAGLLLSSSFTKNRPEDVAKLRSDSANAFICR